MHPKPKIASTMCAIHRREFGASPEDCQETISNFFIDYGIEKDEDVPPWFSELIDAVWMKKRKTFFYPFTVDQIGGVLEEIRLVYDWDFHDDGEWWSLSLPRTGVEVLVWREGGYSCTVTVT